MLQKQYFPVMVNRMGAIHILYVLVVIEVYSIQHYVINFVSNLRQVCGFLWVLRFLPQIKLTASYN